MEKFEVGDLVECLDNRGAPPHISIGDIVCVTKVSGVNNNLIHFESKKDGQDSGLFDYRVKLIKKGNKMNIKQRIKALNNGWDKEADDILMELWENDRINGNFLNLKITIWNDDRGKIEILNSKPETMETFKYNSQCSKNQAFKNALLWLLDKSEINKPKEGDKAEVKVEGQTWEAKLIKKL